MNGRDEILGRIVLEKWVTRRVTARRARCTIHARAGATSSKRERDFVLHSKKVSRDKKNLPLDFISSYGTV